jgi:hypothetical protein
MDLESFERLSQLTLRFVSDAGDLPSLLDFCRYVIPGDLAIVFRSGGVGSEGRPVLVGSSPSFDPPLSGLELDALVGWYTKAPRDTTIHGYSTFGPDGGVPIDLHGVVYQAAVVGFGFDYALMVLRERTPADPYESYHAWAVASLLRAFENAEARARAQRKQIEQVLLSRYEEDKGSFVNESTPWQAIDFILRNTDSRIDQIPIWLYGCEYLGYQARLRWSRAVRKPGDPDVAKFRAIGYANQAIALLASDTLVDDCDEIRRALPGLDSSGEGPWAGPSSAKGDYETWEKASLLVLEHGWRLILKGATRVRQPQPAKAPAEETAGAAENSKMPPSWPPSIDKMRKSAVALLGLSSRLFAARLQVGWDEDRPLAGDTNSHDLGAALLLSGPAASGLAVASVSLLPIGRGALWSYLAGLIARGNLLREKYLGVGEEWPSASAELQREFLLQLARFHLGLVERLEQYHRMDTRTHNVSSTEVLDSLVYLVDRYAHVELGVHESIDIRGHIARGMFAEVQLHLRHGRYRDHLLHVFDVFLLGHLLLQTKVRWTAERDPSPMLEQLVFGAGTCSACGTEGCTCVAKLPPDLCLRNWAVAALLHDIGYQLGQGETRATDAGIWGKYFGLDSVAPASSLGPPKDCGPQFLNTVLEKLASPENKTPWLPEDLCEDDLRDHGILSGFRLAQVLGAMGEQDPGHPKRQARFLVEYGPALHAICFHNQFRRHVSVRTHPLSCLLRLCDELQEWGRQRVNIEAMVKQLYVVLEGETTKELVGHRLLSQLRANISARLTTRAKEGHDRLDVVLCGEDDKHHPHFCFALDYQDPVTADYDPTLTLLSKAYNLQHVDLDGPDQVQDRRLCWRLAMSFPRPREYGDLTEYDVYSKFATEMARWLPTLERSSQGLSRETLDGVGRAASEPDRFAIIVQGKANSASRPGWISSDPGVIAEDFIKFKETFLRRRQSG